MLESQLGKKAYRFVSQVHGKNPEYFSLPDERGRLIIRFFNTDGSIVDYITSHSVRSDSIELSQIPIGNRIRLELTTYFLSIGLKLLKSHKPSCIVDFEDKHPDSPYNSFAPNFLER